MDELLGSPFEMRDSWQEQIDACRAGRDDLSLPELVQLADEMQRDAQVAEAFERSQQLDVALARALADVSVPAGLEARLLACLIEAAQPQVAGAMGEVVEPDVPARCGAAARPSRARWWVGAGGGMLAVAASLAFLVWSLQPAVDTFDAEDIQWAVLDVFGGEVQQGAASGVLLTLRKPSGVAFDSRVASNAQTTWRDVNDLFGRSGVAFDLIGRKGRRATLYVVPLDGPRRAPVLAVAATQPPQNPYTTGGFASGAWQSNDCLYVLVVAGDADDYRELLKKGATIVVAHASFDRPKCPQPL